jgi:hypothetical protein
LLIRLLAPPATLHRRLVQRSAGQGWLERRLEFSLEDNLRLAAALDDVHALLRRDGRAVTCVTSEDVAAAERTAALVEQRLRAA